MADIVKSFKRINFFRGFLATEDDLNEGENYHVMKRALHNRVMHAPGVVPHFLKGMKVCQRGRGDLSVEVLEGYAIDGQGRDLYLKEPVIKTIDPLEFKLPQTVYVVASYVEEPTDFVTYKENPQFKGHKRITEGVRIDVIAREPDINFEVELARIFLEKDVKAIRDALDPLNPRANEIDLRFVPKAGVAGSFLPPNMKAELLSLFSLQASLFAHLGHVLKVSAALDVLHAIITVQMMLLSGYVDFRNLFDLMQMIVELQKFMILQIDREFASLAKAKEFATFKWHIESIKFDRKFSKELYVSLLTAQKNASEALSTMFEAAIKPKVTVKEIETPSEVVWEKIKVRSEPFSKTLTVEGRDFVLVDMLDIYDEASEKAHKFAILKERDRYRSRLKQKYPDGTEVEDVGVHFEGGYCTFEIQGVEPNKDVILITRIDYVRGEYECTMEVNGKKAPNLVVEGNDLKARWRNWPYVIPAELVTEPVLRIVMTPIRQDRDVNIFTLWAYQPK